MHSHNGLSDTVEEIYEAAVAPERWGPVVGRVTRLLDGSAGNLTFQDQQTGQGRVVCFGTDASQFEPYFGYFATRNPLLKITDWPLALRVVTDEDKLPKSELMRTEYYNEFLRPLDTHSVITIRLAIQGNSTTVLNVVRPARRGAFDGADRDIARHLHPHLIRAFRVASRVSNMDAARGAYEDFLDGSATAVFVVDRNGRLRHANRAASAMIEAGRGLTIRAGVLRSRDPSQTRKLHALIGAAGDPNRETRSGGAMALACPDRAGALSITVTPARTNRHALFAEEPRVFICAIDRSASFAVPDDRLQALFGLSRAEIRIARQLLDGRDARETARALGLSYNTVRAHLARMLAKTGTNRQVELVQLLTRAAGTTMP